MPRRHSFERAHDSFDGSDPDLASLSDEERCRLSLERLSHLVELRDTQLDGTDREQQALLHRSIESVFRDCESLGLTREACAILEQGQPFTGAP